jgi:hypothetical protein
MLAQSLVYPSDDPELELVGHRDVMVLVKVTNENRQQAIPSGMLFVPIADDAILPIPLRAPESIPAQIPTSPSFATAYSATIPGRYVRPGMTFTVHLADGEVTQSVAPRVGQDVVMDVVAVPIQIDQRVGQVLPDFGKAIEARMPFTKVNASVHAPYRADLGSWRPVTPADWRVALQTIWGQMMNLKDAENPGRVNEYGHRLHYIAFVPHDSTQEGESMRPPIGSTSAIMDFPASPGTVTKSLVQEMGHHFFLDHAPCGQAGDVDPAYPYANAALGNEDRAIWGYQADTGTFIDPRDMQRHDVMSSCAGDTFSDYNYRKIQRVLAPGGLFAPTRETVGNAH